jgi:hypothetical protein
MKLTRPVTVKAIVTEEFKKNVKEELEGTISKLEAASAQIEANLRRYVPELAKTDLNQASRLRQELEGERARHDQARTELAGRLKEINDLKIGDEFVQGQIESQVEVKVGDSLADKMATAEIITKDGIIVELHGE